MLSRSPSRVLILFEANFGVGEASPRIFEVVRHEQNYPMSGAPGTSYKNVFYGRKFVIKTLVWYSYQLDLDFLNYYLTKIFVASCLLFTRYRSCHYSKPIFIFCFSFCPIPY